LTPPCGRTVRVSPLSGAMKMSPMTNRGDVFMKTKKVRRLLVIGQASAGKTTVWEAGERLGLSSRHVIRRKNRFRKRKLRDSFTRDGAVCNMPVSAPAKRNGTFSASGLAHPDHLRENEIPRGSRLKMRGGSCTHRNAEHRKERKFPGLRSDVPPAGDAGHGEGISHRRDHGS